jgi:putative proteasome-type protease
MLELAVKGRVDIEDASTIALSSMIGTARANLSVGPPYDLAIYRNGLLELEEGRIEAGSPLLGALEERWTALLMTAVSELPRIRPADLAG